MMIFDFEILDKISNKRIEFIKKFGQEAVHVILDTRSYLYLQKHLDKIQNLKYYKGITIEKIYGLNICIIIQHKDNQYIEVG